MSLSKFNENPTQIIDQKQPYNWYTIRYIKSFLHFHAFQRVKMSRRSDGENPKEKAYL